MIQNSKQKFTSESFMGYLVLLVILFETSFQNTDLRIYDLNKDRIFLVIELLLFLCSLVLRRYRVIEFCKMVAILGLTFLLYYFIGSTIFIKLFMMSVITARVGYRNTFKLFFEFRTIMLFLIVGLSLMGVIDTFQMTVAKSDTFVTAYGLGFTHPNRLACTVTYIIFCYICYKKDRLRKNDLVVICVATILAYLITKSRTLLYCTGLFIVLYWLFIGKHRGKIMKLMNAAAFLVMPICVLMSISIPILLLRSTGIIQEIIYAINLAFSRRFTHIEHAFLAYPVSLFGGIFDFESMTDTFGYAVVDNGYIRFMYNYGIIGLIFFSIISMYCIYKLIKKKEYVYVIVCIIAAIQGLLENTYIYIGLNILVMFWGEMIQKDRIAKCSESLSKDRMRKIE